MSYTITGVTRLASGAAVLLLVALLLVRHVFLPRFDEGQLRRFDLPLVLLFGVFAMFLVANFLEAGL